MTFQRIGLFGLCLALGVAAIWLLFVRGGDALATQRGVAAFETMLTVMRHPRCLNCHRSDVPRVRDVARHHIPRVEPADDGGGKGGERCWICHRETNNERARIPGGPGWRMPPFSMSWDGLADADICDNLKDKDMNGQRDLADLAHHFVHDELIKWSWSPGAKRTKPPLAYDTFQAHVKAWINAGAPCPPSSE